MGGPSAAFEARPNSRKASCWAECPGVRPSVGQAPLGRFWVGRFDYYLDSLPRAISRGLYELDARKNAATMGGIATRLTEFFKDAGRD
eukprot:7920448-Pyramimonas_sp.AAC.1